MTKPIQTALRLPSDVAQGNRGTVPRGASGMTWAESASVS